MGKLDLNQVAELGTFEWPKPPYYNFTSQEEKPFPEECIIELFNSVPLAGHMIRFSLDESRILFQPLGSKSQKIIQFNKIKSLQLLWQTELLPEKSFLEGRAEELFPASETQKYKITFIDDTEASGETLGHVNDKAGIYLFSVLKNGKIERYFVPHYAIKDIQIGMQIGEILMEENHVTATEIEDALSQQKDLRSKRIGDYLNENQILSAEELHQAIKHQEKRPVLRLGEALIELDLLTEEELEEALGKQKKNRNLRLGEILINMGIVDERTLKGTLAKKVGIPYVNLEKFNFDPNAIRLVNVSLAKKFTLIPLCSHDGMLVVALEDPMNFKALDELRFMTQLKILPAMASRKDILDAISQFYGNDVWSATDGEPTDLKDDGTIDFESSDEDFGIDNLANKLFDEDSFNTKDDEKEESIKESDNTLVQLVNKMIIDAVKDNVSDIHIETYAGKRNTVVRFRKDGTLMTYLEIPANFRNALISRIKIMSQLDISERRKPQDGKLDFKKFGPKKVELRVATIPTTNNLEDIVMRVLASSKPLPISKLGLAPDALKSIQSLIANSHGLVLVCGPTGSGKTTTLHSLMGHINKPERKIWTAEDPIEITQSGLRQVQVNPKIGWTFASAMRSFLRADPDVIMVGEMRDEETTKIGIEASLTGHLVLSTLHTNSAPESIVRMLDLGMDPFNFADALLGILAQRLAKSLCDKCKVAYEPEEKEVESLASEYVENTQKDAKTTLTKWRKKYQKNGKWKLHKAKGCSHCNQTGYKGRIGIYELMTINPEIKRLIQKRGLVSEITEQALSNGMHTLKQDGISKVLGGLTDIAQVRAVCS